MGDYTFASPRIAVEDSYDAIYERFYKEGVTDGLPIVPPTEERVQRMVAASGRRPDEVVAAEVPPRRAPATVEKIAVNAVMAGCAPEYMPVLIAAAQAMADLDLNLYGVTTSTSPAALLLVINGPIRRKLDVNCSSGCFGPGWRANATIGRTVRFIQLNIGGAVPGSVSKSTQGSPGRYTMCVGEFEEQSPWEPLHVERGFKKEDSTVTVFSAASTVSYLDSHSKSAQSSLTMLSHCMDMVGSNNMLFAVGEVLVVMCPDHARLLARDGYSKQDVRRALFELTQWRPLDHWAPEYHDQLRKQPGRVIDGRVALTQKPEDFVFVTAGGPGGYHSTFVPSWGESLSVTRKIEEA